MYDQIWRAGGGDFQEVLVVVLFHPYLCKYAERKQASHRWDVTWLTARERLGIEGDDNTDI